MDGGWRAVRTDDGSWTLAHPVHGETCHSTAGAWLEARERYAVPCRLRELGAERERVRLLDVGTGLGLNLAAALEALAPGRASLEAVTLERDPTVIRAGLELPPGPDEVERWHAPVRTALARALDAPGTTVALDGARASLCLELGDACERVTALGREPFDAVFLDPFSPAREGRLWDESFLADVARRMAPEALLSTYSSAFSVRLALARAGLRVGLGPRVGRKASGTLAARAAPLPALDGRTARRLQAKSGVVRGEKRSRFA